MNHMADITLNQNTLVVTGELNALNVMSLYEKSIPLLTSVQYAQVDLSKLSSTDSTGVALMVEWVRLAHTQQKKITFQGISAKLQSIINAARLNALFGIA